MKRPNNIKGSPACLPLGMAVAGFTLIELLVVMGLMAMLVALSAPFVTALRSDIAMQRTLRQVKVDLVSILSYSMAGKSFAALSADDLMNADLIPAAYSLYFETDDDYGDQAPYLYQELQAEEEKKNSSMVLSYEKEKEYISPSVYLKEIKLLNAEKSSSSIVDSAYLIVLPPFGKVLFVNDNANFLHHLSEDDFYKDLHNYDEIQLTYQYKDEEINQVTLSLNKNKVINIF